QMTERDSRTARPSPPVPLSRSARSAGEGSQSRPEYDPPLPLAGEGTGVRDVRRAERVPFENRARSFSYIHATHAALRSAIPPLSRGRAGWAGPMGARGRSRVANHTVSRGSPARRADGGRSSGRPG